MGRAFAAVLTSCALVLLAGACDEDPPRRGTRLPCFPEETTYPLGFSEREFDRFFRRALRVAGDRISHEGQGCVEGGRIVADLGMKDLTRSDRRRIEALAPRWVEVNLFETSYSMDELEAFGDRAQAVLEDTGLHISNGVGFYGTPGKIEIYVLSDFIGVHRLLSGVIPQDSFVVRVEGPAVAL